jgi:NADPH-dependent 2,4-dienoyl-CoA reductase/sulfur reductase-like enzyme
MISTRGEQILKQYVIIGNGAAANSAAETIRKYDQTGSIVLFSRESHEFYYTPALPELKPGTLPLFTVANHRYLRLASRHV